MARLVVEQKNRQTNLILLLVTSYRVEKVYQKRKPAPENMSGLQKAFYLAEKMGKELERRTLLQ